MTNVQPLYHFLEPSFGFPLVNYFIQTNLKRKFQLKLVFSKKHFFPKRNILNPLRISDHIKYLKEKKRITNIFRPFEVSIFFVTNVNSKTFLKTIGENSIGLSTGFNQIFSLQAINKFTKIVNLHPSILPYYRGPNPIKWCLKNNEKNSGWTLHEISENIDAGNILFQDIINILGKTVEEIKAEIAENSKEIILQYLLSLHSNSFFGIKKLNPENYYQKKVGYKSFLK